MEESVELALGPSVTIRNVREVAERIAELLSTGRDITINAAETESGDVTLIQILVAARKSAAARGCRLAIEAPSPAFAALVRRCGLAAL